MLTACDCCNTQRPLHTPQCDPMYAACARVCVFSLRVPARSTLPYTVSLQVSPTHHPRHVEHSAEVQQLGRTWQLKCSLSANTKKVVDPGLEQVCSFHLDTAESIVLGVTHSYGLANQVQPS